MKLYDKSVLKNNIIAKAYSIVYWLWKFPVKKFLHVKVVRLKIFFFDILLLRNRLKQQSWKTTATAAAGSCLIEQFQLDSMFMFAISTVDSNTRVQ